MKRYLLAAALAASALSAIPAFAGTNVGVSVSVNQPGVYGRIDIGAVPPPPAVLVYPQPVVISQPPVVVERRPIYLHVPPGHQKNWRKHCAKYAACGQPVYFVREDWYQREYRPSHEHHGHDRDHDRGDRDRHDKGRGHGHGRGHDR